MDTVNIKDIRTIRFAAELGIDSRVVHVFTCRIPVKMEKKGKNGKVRKIDGNTVLYSILEEVYELYNLFSNPNEEVRLRILYNSIPILKNAERISFERFAVKEVFSSCMPRVIEISFDELSDDEINALYDWITF